MRGLETGSLLLAGEALGLPGVGRRRFVALIQLSLGRLLLSRACFRFTGQNRTFPVSVTGRAYRAGKGKERIVEAEFELVAAAVVANQTGNPGRD